ncbi:MAG: ThuA domain-containing protein [Bacteroidota bacterium]|nr:ThuA domain-containing protein [Bacteroidota bacterium]
MTNCFRNYSLFILASFVLFSSCNKRSGTPKVLVFTKTAGYHHSSIAAGAEAIIKLGKENNFKVDTTSDAEKFTEDNLKQYSAIVFLNTTDTADVLLNNYQENAFQRYIEAGGGFVGIHAATDAGYHWGWYTRLVGANFNGHPEQQQATLHVVDKNNISTKGLPDPWIRKDEWYNFKNLNKDVHVLLTIDEKSYSGGTNGDYHPMAWYHSYDGGRAWYTELGHTEESYSDSNYLKHILGGIKYAIGEDLKLNYSNAETPLIPDEDRFTKTQLVEGTFTEPTEMTILPNLDILIAQRRGEIMMYKNDTKKVKQVGFLNVYYKTKTQANAEDGLLGIQKDPDFAKNHYIYIYYSPFDTSVNRLSRFTFKNDSIDPKSEKIVLEVITQREMCCHTGGSIAFGQNRLLYVSTGDNTTPFNEGNIPFDTHSYAPLDDRPGHEHYDDRRSAGNTNDLRGKILRITMNEDGTYSIPDHNLFPKGEAKTRPEIYVMGDRNPYRITVDQKTGFLYWGEVGPDAREDSMETRGPRGYDEFNQARKAGFFGWPFFVGNNYPYRAYDYATGKSGAAFDPARPVNNSRNNTGLEVLPPAQPAYIWYPYGVSKDFPQLGTGGRAAMAGPVYYTDMYPDSTRYPAYYNGKWFIYEWIRGWIKVVTMKPNGDFDNMEPFMLHTKFANPSDMEVGPDGRIYVLEYGTTWFAKNPDAGLARIDYNAGNRPPEITSVNVDKTSGDLPLKITATVKAKDPDNDKISYEWDLGKGVKKETTEPKLEYTLTTAGDYAISVEVKDDKGASSKSNPVDVYAGNQAPTVNIKIEGNKTFYFPGKEVKYEVMIEDKDDTAKVKDLSNLIVAADYTDEVDKAGHIMLSDAIIAKNKMLTLDCQSCHKIAEKSIGPAFTSVSERYQKDPEALARLAQKVINGGSGSWGEVPMAAHPDLNENDAKQIVSWILSLASKDAKTKSLPAKGALNATLNKPVKDQGVLYISADYTDKGGLNIKPLMGSGSVELHNSKVTFDNATHLQAFSKATFNDVTYLKLPQNTGSFSIDSIDLSGISRAAITMGWLNTPVAGYTFELHLDSPGGEKIGEFSFPGKGESPGSKSTEAHPEFATLTSTLKNVNDGKLHDLYIVSKTKNPEIKTQAALSSIQFFLK